MKIKPANPVLWFDALAGAALTALCGLVLAYSVVGESLVNASYDYLSRFSTRAVTNQVEVILMDNEAFHHFGQERGQPWDRSLHAQLLNRLADDGAAMVVVDSLFGVLRDPAPDEALAAAMRRQRHIVLMARQIFVPHPDAEAVRPELPDAFFLAAANEQWGVAWLDADVDDVVRKHWPFPAPGPHPSLPEAAATMLGAKLERAPHERWLRYYGPRGTWASLSYAFALNQPANYYRDKIVFVGIDPATSVPHDGEVDEFSSPYTARTGESIGGVQIMMTSFLNLLNQEWLERPPRWLEVLVFLGFGLGLGFLCRCSPIIAAVIALVAFVMISLGAVSWSHYHNYWFPWLVVSGGQVPCAFACALVIQWIRTPEIIPEITSPVMLPGPVFETPEAPDYELLNPPFGKGSYGRVWLARNATGQWQALKAVYRSNFDDAVPYEREFNGVQRYKPISDKHPGLLRVDFVSQKKSTGYFYYVMELGDPLEGGWEKNPMTYKPRDLASERQNLKGKRISILAALRIGITLADALAFLHKQGLTHRDIKPQNVIFVNGRPKLADLGLIAEIRPEGEKHTYVGTPGYMPPPPESPGTPQADIYALGMLLYVLATGRTPRDFPELSTILAEDTKVETFFELNPIILKACEADLSKRYASADEFLLALKEVEQAIASGAKNVPK